MGSLPTATTTVQDTATAIAQGVDTICIWSPCALHADETPRLFGSASAALAYHGYCEGVEYAALHVDGTGKNFAFVGLPIATLGAVGREDTSGNTGACVTTVAPVDALVGVLQEHDGVLTVVTGGTVGTDQIILGLSLDGGVNTKRIRLGTATTLTMAEVGVKATFSADTLVAGDTIHTWHGSAPRSDSSGWALARAAMAEQTKQYRSIILTGDLQTDTEAQAYLDQINAYETSNDRFLYGRASVRDRLPVATMSVQRIGTTSITATFTEVGATGDTLARAAGSFVTDGFVDSDYITVTGATNPENNAVRADLGAGGVAALTLTLDDHDLINEVKAGVHVTAVGRLTFDLSDRTIVRTRGSWLSDGFRVGDLVDVTDTVSNNQTDLVILTVTASTITFAVGTVLVDEVIAADVPTIATGQTKAVWMADIDAEFASVNGWRLDMSAGRGRKASPLTGWAMRRAAGWAASIREYQHDLHVATWRKSDGPLGYDLYDSNGTLAEWDDRVDGGAGCAARFTTFRSWANGPVGAFIAQSLTRGDDASLLSLTHNVAVVDLAQTTCQTLTENVIGRNLVLDLEGHATSESLATIQSEVNNGLELVLLVNAKGEGPRASYAVWTPSADDILNIPTATLTGVLRLNLNGTIHDVSTTVRVMSGGQQ